MRARTASERSIPHEDPAQPAPPGVALLSSRAVTDVNKPEYWNAIYLANDAGWDKGRAAPPIARLAKERVVPAGATVCVLGAGRGHEAFVLAAEGYAVTAVDFAEEAAKAMRARGGAIDERSESGRPTSPKGEAAIDVLQEDVFALARTHAGSFDAALEHTCFCAIDVARRTEYAAMTRAIVKPGGVFFGLFYAHSKPGGPPFTTTEREVRELFAPLFTIERLVVPADSFENRAGNELEFVFRRPIG